MKFETKRLDNVELFQLEGTLAYEGLATLQNIHEKVIDSNAKSFFFDLEKITTIDPSGVASLIQIYRETRTKSASFALIKPTEMMLEYLSAVGAKRLFEVYNSEKEAIEGV